MAMAVLECLLPGSRLQMEWSCDPGRDLRDQVKLEGSRWLSLPPRRWAGLGVGD